MIDARIEFESSLVLVLRSKTKLNAFHLIWLRFYTLPFPSESIQIQMEWNIASLAPIFPHIVPRDTSRQSSMEKYSLAHETVLSKWNLPVKLNVEATKGVSIERHSVFATKPSLRYAIVSWSEWSGKGVGRKIFPLFSLTGLKTWAPPLLFPFVHFDGKRSFSFVYARFLSPLSFSSTGSIVFRISVALRNKQYLLIIYLLIIIHVILIQI